MILPEACRQRPEKAVPLPETGRKLSANISITPHFFKRRLCPTGGLSYNSLANMKYQTHRPDEIPQHRLIEFGTQVAVEQRVNYVLENAETTNAEDSSDSTESEDESQGEA